MIDIEWLSVSKKFDHLQIVKKMVVVQPPLKIKVLLKNAARRAAQIIQPEEQDKHRYAGCDILEKITV